MKKILLTAFLAGSIGFVVGNAFWYLASPLWIDTVVSEELPAALQMDQVAQGSFRDADSSHKGAGNAAIFRIATGANVLRLTEFETTNGPDLVVWLVKASDIQSSSDVSASEWLSLERFTVTLNHLTGFARLPARHTSRRGLHDHKGSVTTSGRRANLAFGAPYQPIGQR
uniref:DM13 domain-containing protein n=1 Tax=Pararhizobium sp. IMCC3301 TaxID=3067904 RepID=UPI002740691B|nr:DM13 domain-containing protein [Pararhizobium sp. IMCC3301]